LAPAGDVDINSGGFCRIDDKGTAFDFHRLFGRLETNFLRSDFEPLPILGRTSVALASRVQCDKSILLSESSQTSTLSGYW
jgi:hypothetical protein